MSVKLLSQAVCNSQNTAHHKVKSLAGTAGNKFTRQPSRDVRTVHELNINKREIHLVEVKYCEDHGLDTK